MSEPEDSEERYRALFMNCATPIFLWQRSGKDFVRIGHNNSADELTGGNASQMTGMMASEVFHNWPDGQLCLERCYTERKTISLCDKRSIPNTAPRRWFESTFIFVPPDMIMVHAEDVDQRIVAQADLRESEKRFRDLIEGSVLGIQISRMEGKRLFVNSKFVDMFGFDSAEEVLAITEPGALVAPHDRHWMIANRQARERREDIPEIYEYDALRKDGSVMPVQVHARRLNWHGQDTIQRTMIDISERKWAEETLRQSEERFRDIADTASDWFWEMGPDLRLTYLSERYAEATGTRPEDRIGTRCEDFAVMFEPDGDAEKWAAHREDLQSQRPFRNFEYVLSATGGGHHYISASGKPLFDHDGKFLGYRGTATDITEAKRAEQAVKISEQHFRSIFESDTAGNIVIDENGIIENFNTAAEEIFGYRSSEVSGHNVAMLMPDSDGGKHDGYIDNYLKTRDAKIIGVGRKVTGLRKNGETFPMHLGVAAFTVGDHRSFIGSVADLTEIKALEEQLLHAQKLEAVGQLTGGLAHDFNNLLATTLGNAQLLERKLVDQDDLLELLKPIIRSTRRGADLTHRLLAFSRKQTLQPESIRLGELCEGMSDLLKRTLGETIEIKIVADEGDSNILADPGQLENALLNLAINSSHAMADGGNLTIRVENAVVTDREWAERWNGRPGEYVALSVADTGTGMPADVIGHVFEPFFTTKEVGKGSGLGLSMVYGLAQQSGGFTVIESEQGRGTTVTIHLPKAEIEQTDRAEDAKDAELKKGEGEIVLLVEDEPDVRDVTAKLLEMFGYIVLAAEDGAGALEIASRPGRIDLLLSDMVLPGGLNGIEIFHRIREQRPSLKCVFMSGYSTISDEDLPQGTKLVSKPVSMDDLAASSRQILDT